MERISFAIGSNVLTDTNLEKKYERDFSTLKLYKWGVAKLVTDGTGEGEKDIFHGLKYAPIVVVFRKFTAQYTFLSSQQFPNAYFQTDTLNAYVTDGDFFYYADKEKLHIFGPSIGGLSNGSRLPNTEYEFSYMIFADATEILNPQADVVSTKNSGFKVSKLTKNVLNDKDFNMNYTSKHRAIQYYPNHIKEASLTLPAMNASLVDTDVDEATYVDFEHNLGYPPFFLVWSDLGGSNLYEVPYKEVSPAGLSFDGYEEISSWCDRERIRVLFHRNSAAVSEAHGQSYPAKTVSISVIIFAENLLFPGSS